MAAAAGLHSFVAQRGHKLPTGVVFAGQSAPSSVINTCSDLRRINPSLRSLSMTSLAKTKHLYLVVFSNAIFTKVSADDVFHSPERQ